MYQPMISEENIKNLYHLKIEKKKPMTKLINEILDDFFKTHKQALGKGGVNPWHGLSKLTRQ